jgi:MFS family permease
MTSFQGLASAFALFTDYVLCVPLPYTVGKAYGITNPALLGAFFIPVGVGSFLGAPIAGRLSDVVLKREKADYDSGTKTYAPEARLAPAMFASAVLVPGSAVGMGIVIELVRGKVGIALICVLLFLHGISVCVPMYRCNAPADYLR